jgi:hypothetical protein
LVLLNITKLAHSTLRNRTWQHWSFPTWPELDYSSHPRLKPDLFIISIPHSFLLLLHFADKERICVAELKEFQLTYTACYSAVTHPIKPMVFKRNIEPVSLISPPLEDLRVGFLFSGTTVHRHTSATQQRDKLHASSTKRCAQSLPKKTPNKSGKQSNKHSTWTRYNTHPSSPPRIPLHQPKEGATILRKTTLILGPFRRPAETGPNLQVTLKPNSFTR